MGSFLMLFAEILVAVLLVATVITSVRLSKRIAKLQADEQAMRKTIVELMSATETAERAIAGLRNTLVECEKTLADRLRTAERYASDLAEQVHAGEQVMGRIMAAVDNNARTVATGEPPMRRPDPLPAAASAPLAPAREYPREAIAAPVHQSPPRRVSDRISDAAELLAQRAVGRLGPRSHHERGDAA